MANIAPLHWAVTRGGSSLGLAPLYNPTVTRKDSTFYARIATTPKRELVSLETSKIIASAVTPESGLALEGTVMTPTRVATSHIAISTSKQWDTS